MEKSINTAPDEHKSNNSTWSTVDDIYVYVRTECVNHTPDGAKKKKDSDTNIFDRGGTLSVESSEIKIII